MQGWSVGESKLLVVLKFWVSDKYRQIAKRFHAFPNRAVHGSWWNNEHRPRFYPDLLLADTSRSSSLDVEDSFLNHMFVWSDYTVDLDITDREGMASLCSRQVPALEIPNPLRHNVRNMLDDQGLARAFDRLTHL